MVLDASGFGLFAVPVVCAYTALLPPQTLSDRGLVLAAKHPTATALVMMTMCMIITLLLLMMCVDDEYDNDGNDGGADDDNNDCKNVDRMITMMLMMLMMMMIKTVKAEHDGNAIDISAIFADDTNFGDVDRW